MRLWTGGRAYSLVRGSTMSSRGDDPVVDTESQSLDRVKELLSIKRETSVSDIRARFTGSSGAESRQTFEKRVRNWDAEQRARSLNVNSVQRNPLLVVSTPHKLNPDASANSKRRGSYRRKSITKAPLANDTEPSVAATVASDDHLLSPPDERSSFEAPSPAWFFAHQAKANAMKQWAARTGTAPVPSKVASPVSHQAKPSSKSVQVIDATGIVAQNNGQGSAEISAAIAEEAIAASLDGDDSEGSDEEDLSCSGEYSIDGDEETDAQCVERKEFEEEFDEEYDQQFMCSDRPQSHEVDGTTSTTEQAQQLSAVDSDDNLSQVQFCLDDPPAGQVGEGDEGNDDLDRLEFTDSHCVSPVHKGWCSISAESIDTITSRSEALNFIDNDATQNQSTNQEPHLHHDVGPSESGCPNPVSSTSNASCDNATSDGTTAIGSASASTSAPASFAITADLHVSELPLMEALIIALIAVLLVLCLYFWQHLQAAVEVKR